MSFKSLAVMVALPLSLLAGAGSAAASFHHNGTGGDVQGTVTSVTGSSITVQATSGRVTVPISSVTRVSRWAFGSLADIHTNQYVTLHLLKGTSSTVDSINLNTTAPPPAGHPFLWQPVETVPEGLPPHGHGVAPDNHLAGFVTAVSGSSISIKDVHGHVWNYSLASSVTVTKCLKGSLADLAVGETVHIDRGRSGVASLITILSA